MRDLLIIGSGPAGLSAALYARRANLDVVVAEQEFGGTGQIADSPQVDNYLGLAGTSGYDLGEKFRADAESFGTEFYDGEVTALTQAQDHWEASFADGTSIQARAVIYAAGAGHRHLGLPEEETYLGRGVSYCALCDGAFHQGGTVAVVGGGDTALEDALYLSQVAAKVYLIHRRTQFRGAAKTVAQVEATENIEVVTPAQISALTGEGKLAGVTLQDGRTLEVSGLFVAIGRVPQSQLLAPLLELDAAGYVPADETGITDRKGLFVAGDVRTKALRQVVTAVSDGANAATSAAAYLRGL
jgi:thioredoxin reductase (NADPH)